MSQPPHSPPGAASRADQTERLIAAARRAADQRAAGYREQALKLYPWVCGRCGREFQARNLRELTVHHRNHNHDDNPPDGSNWELLCLYCHDNEHARYIDARPAASAGARTRAAPQSAPASGRPFSELAELLKRGKP